MKTIALPTVEQYERAIIELEGPFRVCGAYYGTRDDAAVQRKRAAMRWVARDERRAKRILASTYVPAY